MAKKIIIQTVIVIVSVIILAEVCLRIAGNFSVYSEVNGRGYISEYGKIERSWYHTRVPDTVFIPESIDFNYEYAVNSTGIREKEISKSKPDSVIRILVTGDSFAEGTGAPYDSTWPRLLEKELRARHINAEVINAGVSGSDLLYALALYRDKLYTYEPDVVIASLNTSDFTDYLVRGGTSRFHTDGTTHFNSPPWYEKYYKQSHFLRAMFYLVAGYRTPGLFISNSVYLDSVQGMAKIFSNAFSSYKNTAQTHHAGFAAVLHIMFMELKNPGHPLLKANIEGLEKIDTLLSQSDIPCFNISEQLLHKYADSNPSSYSYAHDYHFKPTGYAFMAKVIADSIIKSGIVTQR